MIKIVEETEIAQGTYLGKDKKGNLYVSDYFHSNNGNRKWKRIHDL
jgi:hypothetical protein